MEPASKFYPTNSGDLVHTTVSCPHLRSVPQSHASYVGRMKCNAYMSITFVLIRTIKHENKSYNEPFYNPYLPLHTFPPTMDKLVS